MTQPLDIQLIQSQIADMEKMLVRVMDDLAKFNDGRA